MKTIEGDDMNKEQALANLINVSVRLTIEANSSRGETKKTTREYAKALVKVCEMLEINPEDVDDLVF